MRGAQDEGPTPLKKLIQARNEGYRLRVFVLSINIDDAGVQVTEDAEIPDVEEGQVSRFVCGEMSNGSVNLGFALALWAFQRDGRSRELSLRLASKVAAQLARDLISRLPARLNWEFSAEPLIDCVGAFSHNNLLAATPFIDGILAEVGSYH